MHVICFFQQDKYYNLRSDFPVPRYNTVKYGKHSIRYLGPHIWGKISQELRSKTSLQAFMLILEWWVGIVAFAV